MPLTKKKKFKDKSDSSRISTLKTCTINTCKPLNNLGKTHSNNSNQVVFNTDEFMVGVKDGSAYASIRFFYTNAPININDQSYIYKLGFNLANLYAYDGITDGYIHGQTQPDYNIKTQDTNVLNETDAKIYAYNIGYNNGILFYKNVYNGISDALNDISNNNVNLPNFNNIDTYNSLTEYKSINYSTYGYNVGYSQTISGNNSCIYYITYYNNVYTKYSIGNTFENPPNLDLNKQFGFDKGYNNAYIKFKNGISESNTNYIDIDPPPPNVLLPNIFNPYENGYAYGWGVNQGITDINKQNNGNTDYSQSYKEPIENLDTNPDNYYTFGVIKYTFSLGFYVGYYNEDYNQLIP